GGVRQRANRGAGGAAIPRRRNARSDGISARARSRDAGGDPGIATAACSLAAVAVVFGADVEVQRRFLALHDGDHPRRDYLSRSAEQAWAAAPFAVPLGRPRNRVASPKAGAARVRVITAYRASPADIAAS